MQFYKYLRLKTILIKQKFLNAHHYVSFFVTARLHTLFHNDELLEGVHRLVKGCGFLLVLGLVGNGIRRLDIVFFASEGCNKVDFKLNLSSRIIP